MNAVTKKQNTEVAGFDDNEFADLGPEQSVSREIVIPKILIMQGQSPRVLDQENNFGELVDTMNWEVLASASGKNKEAMPLEFTPFHWVKLWINKYQVGDKWFFHSIDNIDHTNEALNPFEEWQGTDREGKPCNMKRVFMHLFYVLVPGKPLPYTLGFRGSSKKAGDSLMTQMYVANKMLKNVENYMRSPMGAMMQATPVKKTKDGNTFIELEIKKLRESSKEEAMEALQWYKTVNAGEARVDHSDIEQEGKSEAPQGTVPDDIEF
jgi:hypothetical protein